MWVKVTEDELRDVMLLEMLRLFIADIKAWMQGQDLWEKDKPHMSIAAVFTILHDLTDLLNIFLEWVETSPSYTPYCEVWEDIESWN